MLVSLTATEILWRNALAAIPLALVVAAICRWLPCRPSTRHSLWVIVLLAFFLPPVLPEITWKANPDAPRHARSALDQPAQHEMGLANAVASTAPGPAAATSGEPSAGSHSLPEIPPGIEVAARAPLGALDRPDSSPQSETRPSRTSPDPALAHTGSNADASGSVPVPSPVDGQSGWQAWRSRVGDVRAAIVNLPPVPTVLWFGGIALIAGFFLVRMGRARVLLRRAEPAPATVLHMVERAAAELGLRMIPQTFLLDARISPMVWCGRRVRLLLPADLWRELDGVGRHAVLLHELAHVRRRDHWTCWLQLLVRAVYWWHPVAWWTGRRVAEEADLCCDAWVTALQPRSRRAYAQALLQARQYLGDAGRPLPAAGLGITSGGAKRLTRRLTMVMTQQVRPGLSLRGVALAMAIAILACLATPLWACPPSERDRPKPRAKIEKPLRIRVRPEAPRPARPARPARPTRPAAPLAPATGADDMTTFEQFMRQRGEPTDRLTIKERLDRLERMLDELSDQLKRLQRQRSRGRAGTPAPSAIRAPRPAAAPPAPTAPCAPVTGGVAILQSPPLVYSAPTDHAQVVRRCCLPSCKLDALCTLLIRDDVPIEVRPLRDAIELRASRDDHQVVGAFLSLIDPSECAETCRLPDRKLEALTDLMIRSDVPVLVDPGPDCIVVYGDQVTQGVFKDFLRVIAPDQAAEREPDPTEPATTYSIFAAPADEVEEAEETAPEEGLGLDLDQLREILGVMEEQVRALRASARQVARQARSLTRQSAERRRSAGRLESRAERLEHRADDLDQRAESLDGRSRDEAQRQSGALRLEARRLQDDARQLHAEAESLREQAEAFETAADELNDEAEAAAADDAAGQSD